MKKSSKRLSLEQMLLDCLGVCMSDPVKYPGLYSVLKTLQRDPSFGDLANTVESVWKRHSIPASSIKYTQRRFISNDLYKSLSHTSLLLWEVLCNQVRDTLLFTGKADYFALLLGVSRQWIVSSFKELVSKGFLYIWSKSAGSVPAVYQLNPNLVCSNRFGFHSSCLCVNENSKAKDVYKGGDDYEPVSGVFSSMDASLSSRDDIFMLDDVYGLAFRRVSGVVNSPPYVVLDKVDLASSDNLAEPLDDPSEKVPDVRSPSLKAGLAAVAFDNFVADLPFSG